MTISIVANVTSTAMQTRYVGPGARLPARIIATTLGNQPNRKPYRIAIPYDAGVSVRENHDNAARILAGDLSWHGTWQAGGAADGFVYVRLPPA